MDGFKEVFGSWDDVFFWNLNVLGGLKNGCFMGFWEVFDRVLTGFSWELMNL